MFSRGFTHMPPFPHLQEDNARQGFLEDSGYEKPVAGAELWFRGIVECAVTTGRRRHELLALLVRQYVR